MIGDLPAQEMNPGDIAIIPPMCRQHITNLDTGDLIFPALCTPRFSASVYEDIENNPG